MDVCQAFESFILSRKLGGLSEKSLYCYRSFLTPFVQMYADLPVISLCDDNIASYISGIIDRDVSKTTKATYIRHLKVFVRWLEDNYNIGLNVKGIRVPKVTKKVLRIYNDKEIRQIMQSVVPDGGWLALRNRLVIALMLDSGLRQNEVCSLYLSDIQVTDKLIRVHGKGDKERFVPLGCLTQKYYLEYLEVRPYDREYLFVSRNGKQLTCDAVKHMVYQISRKLPFEFSSHKLRHNFATNYCIDMYEDNGQIDIYRLMVLMGHEDIQTTRRYLHFAEQVLASRGRISHLDKVYRAC